MRLRRVERMEVVRGVDRRESDANCTLRRVVGRGRDSRGRMQECEWLNGSGARGCEGARVEPECVGEGAIRGHFRSKRETLNGGKSNGHF